MKVRVLKEFKDFKENVTRKEGDIFVCTKGRFEEIKTGLKKFCVDCVWVEEVKEDEQSVKSGKKSTGNNDKQS